MSEVTETMNDFDLGDAIVARGRESRSVVVFNRLLIQIVHFYQSDPGDNVFAAHNPGIVTW